MLESNEALSLGIFLGLGARVSVWRMATGLLCLELLASSGVLKGITLISCLELNAYDLSICLLGKAHVKC